MGMFFIFCEFVYMHCFLVCLFVCCCFFEDSVAQGEEDDIPEEEFLRVQNTSNQLEKTETNPCSVSKKIRYGINLAHRHNVLGLFDTISITNVNIC